MDHAYDFYSSFAGGYIVDAQNLENVKKLEKELLVDWR